jgi:hypothetical protein
MMVTRAAQQKQFEDTPTNSTTVWKKQYFSSSNECWWSEVRLGGEIMFQSFPKQQHYIITLRPQQQQRQPAAGPEVVVPAHGIQAYIL